MFNPSASADVSELSVYDDFIELIAHRVKRFRIPFAMNRKRKAMPAYTPEQIDNMTDKYQEWVHHMDDLTTRMIGRAYIVEVAGKIARFGFHRRVGLIAHAIDRVFAILPPNEEAPRDQDVIDATLLIQSIAVNVFGAFDNLAQIWCLELDVRKRNGDPLPESRMSFGEKYREAMGSLTPDLRQELSDMSEWWKYLEAVRHGVAHRDPLYIPLKTVTHEEGARYRELDAQMQAAIADPDRPEWMHLLTEMNQLGRFYPQMVASILADQIAPILFHGQIINDLATVVDFGNHLMDALDVRTA